MVESGSAMVFTGRLNELSLGGCYIEMLTPLCVGTSMTLNLDLGGRKVKLEGIVRNSQPTFGMGIEFVRIDPAEAEKLYALVSELGGAAAKAQAPLAMQTGATSHQDTLASNAAVGEAVLRWFGTHDVLTRDEFRKLHQTAAREQTELTHV
jgi:hypothetical protein